MSLRTELESVEGLLKTLVRDLKAAERDVKRERKDVANAKHPMPGWWTRDLWDAPQRDEAVVEQELTELAEAEARATIARDLIAITRSRADTLRTRIDAGQTESEDTGALAHDLRRMIDTAYEAAADAQAGAIRAIVERREGIHDVRFVRACGEIARTRIQLALLVANLAATRGNDDPTVVTLSAIDLNVNSAAPTESWRTQIAENRARLLEAIELLLPASVYR